MTQTPLLVRSPMTGRICIVTLYYHLSNGILVATQKFDVTEQFEALVAEATP